MCSFDVRVPCGVHAFCSPHMILEQSNSIIFELHLFQTSFVYYASSVHQLALSQMLASRRSSSSFPFVPLPS